MVDDDSISDSLNSTCSNASDVNPAIGGCDNGNNSKNAVHVLEQSQCSTSQMAGSEQEFESDASNNFSSSQQSSSDSSVVRFSFETPRQNMDESTG